MLTALLVTAGVVLAFIFCAAIVSGNDRRNEEEDLQKWAEEQAKKGEK